MFSSSQGVSFRQECLTPSTVHGSPFHPAVRGSHAPPLADKHCPVCGGTPPKKGACCEASGTMGCNVAACEYAICVKQRPECCQAWTQECVALAEAAWQCPVCHPPEM